MTTAKGQLWAHVPTLMTGQLQVSLEKEEPLNFGDSNQMCKRINQEILMKMIFL